MKILRTMQCINISIRHQISTCFFLFFCSALHAETVFISNETVTSVDRMATFDSLNRKGISLGDYSEDSLYVTTGGTTYINPATGFTPFAPNDFRTSGFHYENIGNNGHVSIRTTDSILFYAADFLVGDGTGINNTLTDIRWEAYLDGELVNSGVERNITKGSTVGWSNSAGLDELRVAAYLPGSTPGFGNPQAIALDDLRVQISPIPLPASALLFGSALATLFFKYRRRRIPL